MSVRPASHFLTRSPGGFRADFSAPKGRGLWRRRPRCRSAIGPTRLHESVDQLVIFRSHSMLCPDRSTSSAWRRDCAPPPHLHNSKKSSSRQSVELFTHKPTPFPISAFSQIRGGRAGCSVPPQAAQVRQQRVQLRDHQENGARGCVPSPRASPTPLAPNQKPFQKN